MDYLTVIFTLMLKKFHGSRTIYGAFHILKGKKSAQTIQDCQLFKLSQFFGVYKDISREEVVDLIKILEKKQFIKECGSKRYQVTTVGDLFLKEKLKKNPVPAYLNGFVYKDSTEVFWRRLSLFIQCISFLEKKKRDFIPITRDIQIQLWVKQRIPRKEQEMSSLAANLYKELHLILQTISSLEADLFVLKLSGYHRIGLTIDQVAQKFHIDRSYAKILFISSLHRILHTLALHKEMYPILYSFLNRPLDGNLLTETAKKTFTLLTRGYSAEDISKMRNLKQNTIEDHIVEIAMNEPNFSIDEYVSLKDQKEIIAILENNSTRSLKEIKEQLKENISYFSIRLTMVKKGTKDGFK